MVPEWGPVERRSAAASSAAAGHGPRELRAGGLGASAQSAIVEALAVKDFEQCVEEDRRRHMTPPSREDGEGSRLRVFASTLGKIAVVVDGAFWAQVVPPSSSSTWHLASTSFADRIGGL